MKPHLLSILACPQCKGPLTYDEEQNHLICKAEKLAFPIIDDIPRLTLSSAVSLCDDNGT